MKERQQGVTTYPLVFLLVSSSDHVSPVTGATVTVTLSKNGGSFGAASGAVSEIGSGWYSLGGAGLAADLGTLGPLVLHATAAGADPTDSLFTVVPWNPFDGLRMGLTALPNAASSAAGGLMGATAPGYYAAPPSAAAVAAQVDSVLAGSHGPGAWGGDPWSVDVVAGAGTAYTGDMAGKLLADWRQSTLVAAVADTSAAPDAFKLGSGASASDDAYVGQSLTFLTGALARERRVITAYDGATKTAHFGITPSYPAATAFSAAPANGDLCEIV